MKKYAKQSLNRKLVMISFAVFIPMFAVVAYMLVSMSNTAKAYAQITTSVSSVVTISAPRELMFQALVRTSVLSLTMTMTDGDSTVTSLITMSSMARMTSLFSNFATMTM